MSDGKCPSLWHIVIRQIGLKMAQSLVKPISSLCCGLTEWHYQKSSIEVYKLTKVLSIFNEESVGWNLNKQMLVSLHQVLV